MKLQQIIQSQPALKSLLEVKLPVKVAYKISKLINKIEPEFKIYEEQRNKLIKELGEQTNKETDTWTVRPENMPKFSEEVTKLLEIEVNIDPFPGMPMEKIKVEELGEVSLSSNDLVLLSWLIE